MLYIMREENRVLLRILLSVVLWFPFYAAGDESAANPHLTERGKSEVLSRLGESLQRHYVFVDSIPTIIAGLNSRLASGSYKDLHRAKELAAQLTRDLQAISKDLHFVVEFDPDWIAEQQTSSDPEKKQAQELRLIADLRSKNFGFDEVRILEGNVGYVNFSYFANPDYAHGAAASVMQLVEHTDALVFDVRNNSGGYLEMAQLLASYLFSGTEETRLYSYYTVEDGVRIEKEDWVLPFVPGRRRPDRPVYVVTSNTSFSAAEWFAYILKNLGRATIIGEQTAGGAHPVERKAIDERFLLQVPIGELRDANRGTDFEGVGVKPDVEVPAHEALDIAHRAAIERLTLDPMHKANAQLYAWLLPVIDARIEPIKLSAAQLQAIAGKYEGRTLSRDGDDLIYSWGGKFWDRLIPLSETLFMPERAEHLRFEVLKEKDTATALRRISSSGGSTRYARLD